MKRKLLLLPLFLIFLATAMYSGYRLITVQREYEQGEEVYEELTQYIRTPQTPEIQPPAEETEIPGLDEKNHTSGNAMEDILWPTVDFEALQAINPDVTGWICLENTVVNYPIVQGLDNSSYMDRLFDGSYNSAGSIFMDYRNQPELTDRNTVLYGHNMKNKSMFATITNYKKQSYYEEHPCCLILTPEKNYKLEFFAGYVADLNSQAWKLQFGSDEEYAQWLADAIAASTFESGITPQETDRVITLSTCSYEFADARYVLLGVLREAETQTKAAHQPVYEPPND